MPTLTAINQLLTSTGVSKAIIFETLDSQNTDPLSVIMT